MFKVCKLLLTAVGHAEVQVVAEACQSDSAQPPTPYVHQHALVLQQALHHIPNPNAECMTRNVAIRLGQQLGEQVKDLSAASSILPLDDIIFISEILKSQILITNRDLKV